ncbi:MAG: coproporphyrinogen III oxidase [Proteobacteria bacterium]|nr:coproporphyrinogen III oxidase [Pseudomonadota bacterium]
MTRTRPNSSTATDAETLVTQLQRTLVARLEGAASACDKPERFIPVSWLRDGGRHGGGERWVAGEGGFFNRASANVSVVHYDDLPDKALRSATALSCIVHPAHPLAPSLHMHMSWTELRDGRGSWRMMADLNPSNPLDAHTERFRQALIDSAGAEFESSNAQGDKYFHIPALGRHRGVVHYYAEGHNSGDWQADAALAQGISEAVIAVYGNLIEEASGLDATDAHAATQLAYHTLYLFQVLTLDRGTTSGLLIHSDNDQGILGSLPSHVDSNLLASWEERVPDLQKPLVRALVKALNPGAPSLVDAAAKQRLVDAVRAHYTAHPEALALQARGNTVPPTVANHR